MPNRLHPDEEKIQIVHDRVMLLLDTYDIVACDKRHTILI